MRTEIVRSRERFAELREAWGELVAHMDSPDLYDTWEWVDNCLRDYHLSRSLFIVVVYDNDRCAAIAPLIGVPEKIGGIRIRTLRFITFGTTMYNGFCLHRAYSESVLLKHIKDAVAEHADEWDLLKFEFVNSKRNATFLARKVFEGAYKVYMEEQDFVPYLRYDANGPDKTNVKELKDVERRQRKLMREHRVEIHLERPFDPFLWETAMRWHLTKWDNSTYQDAEYRRFCRRLYERLSERGHLGMAYMTVDGQVAAVNVYHTFGRKVYGKLMNFAPEYAPCGIGLILLNNLLKHFREKGMEEYDFEGGTQNYKFYWTDTIRRNFNYYIVNNNRKKAYVCLWLWAGVFARQSGTYRHWNRMLRARWLPKLRFRRRPAEAPPRGTEAQTLQPGMERPTN